MAHHALPLHMPATLRPPPAERAWSRASWIVLVLAVGFMLTSAAQKAYRLTLPTDGWSPLVGAPNLVFETNVLGVDSPLRADDELLAVEGRDVTDWIRRGQLGELTALRPPNWQIGQTVRYTVRRGEQTLDLAVPLHGWDGRRVVTNALEGVLNVLPLLLIAFFVVFKRPGHPAARLLLLFGAAQGSFLLSYFDQLLPGIETPFASTTLYWLATICTDDVHNVIYLPIILYLALTFPVLSLPARRFPRLTPVLVIVGALLSKLFAFAPVDSMYGVFWFMFCIVATIGVLIYNWCTVREPVARVQARLVGFGFAYFLASMLTAVLSFVGVLPRWTDGWLFPFPELIFGAAIAVAILRYHLFDLDVVVNRALVYGTLTAFVIGAYIGIVGYLGALLQVQNQLISSLVATGFVAVVFQPVRERMQRGVNRLLYGQRDEPYAVITQLSERLSATFAPNAVLPAIVQTVREALKLPYAAITLRQPDDTFALRADAGAPVETSLTLPLTYQHESVGQLLLAPRAPHEPFAPADLRLIDDLARQAGVAAHAVQLTDDLQRSRERLVATREEERRRLRRDLHDGLGPALATMTLQADTARSVLRADPDEADALLQDLTAQAQTTMRDVRALIYALRPPALDDLGLVAALRALAASSGYNVAITLDAPDALPPLLAAVEAAAYRIVQEALTNVAKHAQARSCTVRLTVNEETRRQGDKETQTLLVEITDDGIGLADERHAGVGLSSMRERAEELGGCCVIQPGAAGGTIVRATLPVPERRNEGTGE